MDIQKYKNKIILFLVLSVVFILLALLTTRYFRQDTGKEKAINVFHQTLHEKERDLDKILNSTYEKLLSRKILKEQFEETLNFQDLFTEKGSIIFIYSEDSLVFWSDNQAPVSNWYEEQTYKPGFYHLTNGWYEVRSVGDDNIKVVGLLLIKYDYRYQNDYLINAFQNDFTIAENTEIIAEKGEINILSVENNFLFSLQFYKKGSFDNKEIIILLVLYLCGLLFFISVLYYLYRSVIPLANRPVLFIVLFSLDLILIRFVLFYFEIPAVLYKSTLFSPLLYATSESLPSLGDFLVNVILLLVISYVLYKHLPDNTLRRKRKTFFKYSGIFLLFMHVIIFYSISVSLIRGLIINSNISFNLNNIFSLSVYSIIGFFIIAALLASYFLVSCKLLNRAYILSAKPGRYFIMVIVVILSFCVYWSINDKINIIHIITVFVFISSFWLIKRRKKGVFNFSGIVFYLVLFSFISTYSISKYKDLKEKEKRKLLAIKLSSDRDEMAEYKLKNISSKIFTDNTIINHLASSVYDEKEEEIVIDHIVQKYFDEYWTKYNLVVTICGQEKELRINPGDYIINCNEYFNGLIKDFGKLSVSDNLYYIDYGSGIISYLASFSEFYNSNDTINDVNIFIEIVPKSVQKGLGYPELLINKDLNIRSDLSNYSYALYSNDELVRHNGKYFYSINQLNYGEFDNTFTFFERNSYSHLFYKISDTTNLIISKRKEGVLNVIAPFSYLLIFFGVFVILFLAIINIQNVIKKQNLNFRNRLQFSMIAIILASFLIIGISSLFYIIKLNDNKNIDILREKTNSVLIELEHKLANEEELTPEIHDYLSGLLLKFSMVFFSDINVYDLNGNLIASSRQQIFEEGLISDKMNSDAYSALVFNKKSFFIHNENIGKYDYLSAYVPFRNDQNKLIAYLNLPYFAKQNELKNEISTFLIAFINIYVILIAVAVFIALFISNYIMRPLKLIKEKISHFKLGKSNEKIEWNKQDEIGSLITEYNRMIDELTKSARLLAKSERESAWREMAKQVAHEIKNPLTPMKLSVQYLQKAWNEKTEDWEQRLESFTKTLIEQIDTLSTIASEFSDFAIMPQMKKEKAELITIISNVIELYKDFDNIHISLKQEEQKSYYIYADKKQLLRVFNNLIKNSAQAIGSQMTGIIEISINKKESNYLLKISDNGRGIAGDQAGKIFSPNFTTKTGGMGLGLAMVKNIILDTGGEIWFESEKDKGTTFFIKLPIIEQTIINQE